MQERVAPLADVLVFEFLKPCLQLCFGLADFGIGVCQVRRKFGQGFLNSADVLRHLVPELAQLWWWFDVL